MTIESPPSDTPSSLLHRWGVEYNPLYLASAALVLGGIWLLSREAARHETLIGTLGVGGLAEAYSFALIGSAGILLRIGQKRSAAMLGLIATAYLGDLTMHTETSVFLGEVGIVASAGWWAIFTLKLVLLMRALGIRASRGLVPLLALGAFVVAALPHLLVLSSPIARRELTSVMVLGIALLAALLRPSLSLLDEDAGDDIRVRRSLRAALGGLALVALLHVAYWGAMFRFGVSPLLALVPILVVPSARSEKRIVQILALFGFVVVLSGASTFAGLLGAGLSLALAARRARECPEAEPEVTGGPYREGRADPPRAPRGVVARGARARLLSLSWFTLAASAAVLEARAFGSPGWGYGVSAALLAVAFARIGGTRWIASPLGLVGLYFAWPHHEVIKPRTHVEWGILATFGGFALLATALMMSVWIARRERRGVQGFRGDAVASDWTGAPGCSRRATALKS